MPGLDLSRMSSNWKKLQEKLQADKKKSPKTGDEEGKGTNPKTSRSSNANGVKRKRTDSKTAGLVNGSNNSNKRTKVSTSSHAHPLKHPRNPPKPTRNMGLTASQPEKNEPTPSSSSHASLARTHDISASDLATAYGSGNPSEPNPTTLLPEKLSTKNDTPNTGLHPTHKAGKYISLDCEMVGFGEAPAFAENMLARVSAVNYHGEQLYDSYVLPTPGIAVKDYRTRWSGIQPEHLLRENGARSFNVVQREISALIAGRVVVGHALKNDLGVLQLKVSGNALRDTSLFAPFRKLAGGRAPALRVLAERELGWRIQGDEVNGHSSLEDARAAMMVFRKVKVALEGEMKGRVGGLGKVPGGIGGEGRRGRGISNGDLSDDDDGDDAALSGDADEDDMEDGEFDSEDEGGDGEAPARSTGGSKSNAKKKRKKKKRTKRK